MSNESVLIAKLRQNYASDSLTIFMNGETCRNLPIAGGVLDPKKFGRAMVKFDRTNSLAFDEDGQPPPQQLYRLPRRR